MVPPMTECQVCHDAEVPDPHRTCPTCIGSVRSDLVRIPQLVAELDEQALEGSTPGGRLLAAQPIPGGDAMVLMAVGSSGLASVRAVLRGDDLALEHEHKGDPEPVDNLLVTWAEDFRSEFGHHHGTRRTLTETAEWLREQLALAAHKHPAFDEFAQAIARCRAHLEGVLGYGPGDQRGASCVWDGATLIRKATERKHRAHCTGHGPLELCAYPPAGCCDRGGVDLEGEWHCPKCKRRYSAQGYDNAVRAAAMVNATALTDRDMHEVYGVPRGTLRRWASEGRVHKRGKAEDGRTLYDVADVRAMTEASEEAS